MMLVKPALAAGISLILLAAASSPAADEIVIADFEGETYGKWTATGTAFGPGPAKGALPGQMAVSGYLGERLVNSFFQGDGTTGVLTSPPFRIERPWINFLIGGGGYAGETCMNLKIRGETVRTATGSNSEAGGSEQLEWQSWDVRDFVGQEAILEIVDQRTGGWGHINVDHIVQSEHQRQLGSAERKMQITKSYLHLPVKTGARKQRMQLKVGDKIVREFDIELAAADADFTTFLDVGPWKGKELTIHVNRVEENSPLLDSITQSDQVAGEEGLYEEAARPQFHFTSRRGWLNDPNGLVYFQGEWHLFYQHNPYGWNWGNMHWGHAVSPDLVHWKELGDAIFPWSDAKGAVFSGSAVIDVRNTSGFQSGDEPPLIAAFTDTEAGEAIAYSNDRGRTFEMYAGNPVIKHRGRDPKVFWHEPTSRWVMAVYDESHNDQAIAFYTSPDLKQWEFASRIVGWFECPDLFELPIDGNSDKTQWVLFAADGKYALGKFDGREFTPDDSGKHELWHGNFYAAQTYSNAPQDRRILIGWARGIEFPGMPFNQQMTVPMELTLRSTSKGVRMFAEPAHELNTLRGKRVQVAERPLRNEASPIGGIQGHLLDVQAEFKIGSAKTVGVTVCGERVDYRPDGAELRCGNVTAKLMPARDRLSLRILVDRGSVEVFANGGERVLSVGKQFDPDQKSLAVFAEGGEATLLRLDAYELKSAWRE